MLTLIIHWHLAGHQCQNPTRLKIAYLEMQQPELAVVGSADMSWAKCAWKETRGKSIIHYYICSPAHKYPSL